MSVIIVLCLGGLMYMLNSFQVDGSSPSGGTSLACGYLLLSAYFVGRLFEQARLPKLTGYIVTGMVVGPSGLSFLTDHAVEDLKLVNGVAVVLIALSAGIELDLRSMRPLLRSIGWITLTAVVGTAVLLTAATFLLSGMLPFLAGMDPLPRLAASAVLGVVMAAQSPAVVVALNDEMESEGPLTRTVLGVVVFADLVVILLFALTSSVAKAALGSAADLLTTLKLLAWELFASIGIGAVLGVILTIYLRRVGRGMGMFLLIVALVIAEVGLHLHLDPLLVALAAGVLIRNATRAGEAFHDEIEGFSLPIYVLFFAVAGANLHLDALAAVGGPVLILVLVRASGMLAGARVGARLAGSPEEVKRFSGFGLLPQAGLALALSLLFARAFPEFGEEAGALTLGIVAMNELFAPVAYRFALVRSGEAGKRRPAEGRERPDLPGMEQASP